MGNKAIYASEGKRVIGILTPDGVFIQKVRQGHVMRWGNAKGLDVATWRMLVAEGCKLWRLEFIESGTSVELVFSKVAELGDIREVDKKAGRQIFVSLEHFKEMVIPKRYVE